jgi:hypothetical protein
VLLYRAAALGRLNVDQASAAGEARQLAMGGERSEPDEPCAVQ